MGVSKIRPIRFTIQKALKYVVNPNKTEGQTLVSAFQCSTDADTAAEQFKMTAQLAERINHEKAKFSNSDRRNILAYHLIQSFDAEDRLTPEQVHEIGKEWAEEILGGKFEYVIATHTDTNNLHNHIIFNAVSIEDMSKWHVWNDAKLIREKNDLIRQRHGLKITQAKENSKSKNPRQQPSFRKQLRKIINECIRQSENYDEFKRHLSEHHVEIKEGKYLSFRMYGQQRFTRDRSLGENYSRGAIEKRIGKQQFYRNRVAGMARSTKLAATRELANTLLLMRSENIQQFSDFDLRMKALQRDIQAAQTTMSTLKDKVHQQKQAMQLIRLYNQLKPIAEESQNQSKFSKKRFDKQHEKELETFEIVQAKLVQLGLRTDISDERADKVISAQQAEIQRMEDSINQIIKRADELAKARDIVVRIENGEQFVFAKRSPESEQNKQKDEKNKQRQEGYSW